MPNKEFLCVNKFISENGFMLEAEIPKDIGICAKNITIEVNKEGKIVDLAVIGGCAGNLEAVARLIKGLSVQDAREKLKGIPCGKKDTSCPDTIAKILRIYT